MIAVGRMVGMGVAGMLVAVGGTVVGVGGTGVGGGVEVGGTGVAVGGIGVWVGNTGVGGRLDGVGGTLVAVGGIKVRVGMRVAVGGMRVAVGGMRVGVGGTGTGESESLSTTGGRNPPDRGVLVAVGCGARSTVTGAVLVGTKGTYRIWPDWTTVLLPMQLTCCICSTLRLKMTLKRKIESVGLTM
jgi:hypothetical protein